MTNPPKRLAASKSEIGGKPQRRGENLDFAKTVLQSRQKAGLSQPELARLAGVSPKTIVQLEKTGIARWDAIARIARALGESVDGWLLIAGHSVPQSRIEDVLRGKTVLSTFPFRRMDPADYYAAVAERVKKHTSALMCTCVLSPVPLATKDLENQMKMVLSAGLHFALLCPFPVADQHIASSKPRLNQYYASTYTWVCNLAVRLGDLAPKLPNRVHVFAPRIANGGATLVNTPVRANELRPSFTKYSSNADTPAIYEFGAYIRYVDSRADQWIEIYGGEGEMSERALEAYGPWHDYCSDILDAWSAKEDGSHYDPERLAQGAWRQMPIGKKTP